MSAAEVFIRPASITSFTDEEVRRLVREAADTEGVTKIRILRKGTEVDDDGVVHVRLRRKTRTLVTKYIGPLEKFTIATVSGQAGTN